MSCYDSYKMKSKPIHKLEKDLWKTFSLYIRLKYSDKNGYVSCYTCPARKHYKEMQAGHYIKRSYKSLKFDERNVRPQDPRCNMFLDGNQDEFAVKLEQEYGLGILQELHRLKWEEKRFTRLELTTLLTDYKQRTVLLLNKIT